MKHIGYIAAMLILTATAATAQPSGNMIAGQPSPWENAHFVLWSYGAVWAGLALYVWRIAALGSKLKRELTALETLVKDDDPTA